MGTRRFCLEPGIAAYLDVLELDIHGTPVPGGINNSAIFLSIEKGVTLGVRGFMMKDSGWPMQLQAEINKHFSYVFNLEHEHWNRSLFPPGTQSPRAQYCESLVPWVIEIEV